MDTRLLAAQLLKSRETKITIGRFTFNIRRPTDMELMRLRAGESNSINVNLELIRSHITGWSGVLESDIVSGESSDPVPFDMNLYQMWIEERSELWEPLIKGFTSAIAEQDKRAEALQGNSSAP